MADGDIIDRETLQESDNWRRSVGKKVIGIHYRERDGTGHAVCPPGEDTCYVHHDEVNPHKHPVRHLLKDAPEVLAAAGLITLFGAGTSRKLLKFLR